MYKKRKKKDIKSTMSPEVYRFIYKDEVLQTDGTVNVLSKYQKSIVIAAIDVLYETYKENSGFTFNLNDLYKKVYPVHKRMIEKIGERYDNDLVRIKGSYDRWIIRKSRITGEVEFNHLRTPQPRTDGAITAPDSLRGAMKSVGVTFVKMNLNKPQKGQFGRRFWFWEVKINEMGIKLYEALKELQQEEEQERAELGKEAEEIRDLQAQQRQRYHGQGYGY